MWPRQSIRLPVGDCLRATGPQLWAWRMDSCTLTPLLRIAGTGWSIAYSKDGSEQRSPALATFWNQRFEAGVKISKVILEIIEDPNLQ